MRRMYLYINGAEDRSVVHAFFESVFAREGWEIVLEDVDEPVSASSVVDAVEEVEAPEEKRSTRPGGRRVPPNAVPAGHLMLP